VRVFYTQYSTIPVRNIYNYSFKGSLENWLNVNNELSIVLGWRMNHRTNYIGPKYRL